MTCCRRVPVTAGTVCCALVLAACGSASTYSTSGSAGPSPNVTHAFVAFSQCMRNDGVTNFPDPKGGGGIQFGPGINPSSSAFRSARSKCKHLLPGGGPPSGPPSAQAKLAALRISQCMRRHGVTGFPRSDERAPLRPERIQRDSRSWRSGARRSQRDQHSVAGVQGGGRGVRLRGLKAGPAGCGVIHAKSEFQDMNVSVRRGECPAHRRARS